MQSIFLHTQASYSAYIYSQLGKGYIHAQLIYKEWYQKGSAIGIDPAFKNAQGLLKNILELTDFSLPLLINKKEELLTEKFLLKTADNLETESVVLPMKAGLSLCISSQIGCQMGCAFCETGKMGLIRSLKTEEIVAQLFHAKFSLGFDIRNIVFMGMGEPLDNYDAVMQAVKIFCDPNGFGLGPSRITISTSGLVDRIHQLISDVDPALNLAISVNGSNDFVRGKLMPVNKRYDMQSLLHAMRAYCAHPRRRILVEYVMIKGRTDAILHAEELAHYLNGLRVTINLIPYNPQTRGCFEASEEEVIEDFAQVLRKKGYLVFVRDTKGQRIMAACGQLGNLKFRNKIT